VCWVEWGVGIINRPGWGLGRGCPVCPKVLGLSGLGLGPGVRGSSTKSKVSCESVCGMVRGWSKPGLRGPTTWGL